MNGESSREIIVLGADHNGVELKEMVKKHLKAQGFACIDVGPATTANKVDYVDYAAAVATIVNNKEADRGILICGTGVGMSIVANRYPSVRASLVHSVDVARKSREHNDSNLLCLGAWVNSPETNIEIVDAWMGEKFGQGRHVPRVEKTKAGSPEKIVFTNGVFDVLHSGHIRLLKFAKSLGGKLVVGINSDRATKMLKGETRPIFKEHERKEILESIRFVDEVVIFDDTKTVDIVALVHPNILVKGGEWTADEVRERDSVPTDIEVKTFPLIFNPAAPDTKYSTTDIIKNIRD